MAKMTITVKEGFDELSNKVDKGGNEVDTGQTLRESIDSNQDEIVLHDGRLNELEGLSLSADQALQEIYIKDLSGSRLATLNVAFLNNEGTSFTYNEATEKLELRNDANELLAEVPVGAFVSNLAKSLDLTGSRLTLKDTTGQDLDYVDFDISNINGLQAALDSKETPTGAQTKADQAEADAIAWVKSKGLGITSRNLWENSVDDILENSFYYVASGASNKPEGVNYGYVLTQVHDSGHRSQMLIGYDNDFNNAGFFFRTRNVSGWDEWKQITDKEYVDSLITAVKEAQGESNAPVPVYRMERGEQLLSEQKYNFEKEFTFITRISNGKSGGLSQVMSVGGGQIYLGLDVNDNKIAVNGGFTSTSYVFADVGDATKDMILALSVDDTKAKLYINNELLLDLDTIQGWSVYDFIKVGGAAFDIHFAQVYNVALDQATIQQIGNNPDNIPYELTGVDGAEMIQNGGFDDTSVWTIDTGSGWDIANGVATHTPPIDGPSVIRQTGLGIEDNSFYKVSVDISNSTAGSIELKLAYSSTGRKTVSGNGTHEFILQVTNFISDNILIDTKGTGFDGSIDNISVTKVGNIAKYGDAKATDFWYDESGNDLHLTNYGAELFNAPKYLIEDGEKLGDKYLRKDIADTKDGDLILNDNLETKGLTNAAGIYSIDTDIIRIANPKGGIRYQSGYDVTGAIKIVLPVMSTDNMISFTVDISLHDYTNNSASIRIGGYNQGNDQWSRVFARNTTNSEKDYLVRFGNDGVNNCIWIGELSDTWDFPRISIKDIVVASNSPDEVWAENWGIQFVTSFDTVNSTLSDNLPYADFNKLKNLTAAENEVVLWDGSGKKLSDLDGSYIPHTALNKFVSTSAEDIYNAQREIEAYYIRVREDGGEIKRYLSLNDMIQDTNAGIVIQDVVKDENNNITAIKVRFLEVSDIPMLPTSKIENYSAWETAEW